MGVLNKLFGKKPKFEHAIRIQFQYGEEEMDKLYQLRDKNSQQIQKQNLGEFDGHEIATDLSDGFLFMYGQNAELLFNGIKPILEKTDFMQGAKATLRFGPPEEGTKEIIVDIEIDRN